jgi:hypothetical protein
MKRVAYFAAVLMVLVLAVYARDFVMPKLIPATSMAFRDSHPQEMLTVGADAYDTSQKASLFHPDMRTHAVLPVLVVITNDAGESVALTQVHFQLVTRDRAKADPYTIDDLRRVFTAIRPPGSRTQDKLPIPLPGKNKAHGGLSQKDHDELEHAMFAVHTVEPHSSQQGFLFFDVGDLEDPTQGARLFVTGVNDAHGHELMYFEVPLGKP